MNHPYINWTKSYNVNHQKGTFRVFISSHKDGNFLGAVLYYNRTGEWSEHSDTIHLGMQLEQFIGRSEGAVYNECVQWIDGNLEGEYTITLDETKEFNK